MPRKPDGASRLWAQVRWGFAAGELAAARDLAAALEPAARVFEAWEVTGEGPWLTAEGLAPVRAALPSFRFRVTFHAAFRAVDLAAPDPAARARHVELVRGQLAAARGLGAEAVVVHPGKRIRGLADPRAEERCAESLRALAAEARGLGLALRVENMPRGPDELGQGGAALRPLAEAAGGACWDAGHARTWGGEPDLAAVAALVEQVHLHDNRGTNDDHWPLSPASTWVPGALRGLAPGALVTLEHRTVAEGLASRAAARALLS